MRIKRKNALKVAAITIALLLCLALAVGITGAWYQAQRQATGTLSMDQGIIIDYKGFGKTGEEESGIWSRETTTTFLLFDETNAQPGEQITVNAAGIRANENSVNFYARVKLTYKFYNGETPVELADATKLIKTSSSFWANSWVDGGSTDGYYYYATGSTLNKFEKGAVATTPFVDLFSTDAKFVIEGENFVGADNGGEGGGFVVGDTSINKIEVYLTLETLQGDADAAAEGWKISSQVDFAKVDEGKIVKSNTTEVVTDEQLNVTINGNETTLETVKFPYGEETILEFDSKNVEYVELIYSDTTTEKFYELEASENSATKYSQIQVLADENKKVTGYTVGVFGGLDSYTGLLFSNSTLDNDGSTITVGNNELVVSAYIGNITDLTIPSEAKVRQRDLKAAVEFTDKDRFIEGLQSVMGSFQYPCTMTWTINGENKSKVFNSSMELMQFGMEIDKNMSSDDFAAEYAGPATFTYSTYCVTTRPFTNAKKVTHIGYSAFSGHTELKSVVIPESITFIAPEAFSCDGGVLDTVTIQGNNLTKICYNAFNWADFTTINIPESVNFIGGYCFQGSNLTMKLSDLSGTWVKAEDGSEITDTDVYLKDIDYDIKKV